MSKGKSNREIGDPLDEVARTGKIGGRQQPAKSPDSQTFESPSIQQSDTPILQDDKMSATQHSEVSTVQHSEMVKGQTMNSLEVQDKKGTHKGRTQKTIYLPPALAKRLNYAAVDEEREISEIVTDALEAYFQANLQKNQ